MRPSRPRIANSPKSGLLWLWTVGAGLVGMGVGLIVLIFEHAPLNDTPGSPQDIFIFMQAALLLGVAAGVISPAAWVGKRGSAALAGLLGSVILFIIVSVQIVNAGNGSALFFGCFTLPFLLVSILGAIFGSWIGALLADVRKGEG
ncbi:MAG TPA: hypothetical protein VKT82_04450 [Ktedonobacterales bacterium]|nr:hypothetical protein [Ktedonobacterales bacterium]